MKNKSIFPVELDEKTRINLAFNNFWAILVSVIMFTFSSALIYFQHIRLSEKMDEMLITQGELKKELRDWKQQAEARLGGVESDQNSIIGFLENHLNIKINRADRYFR